MYAILGATGKVGGAAVRDLRHRGLTVRAIVRDARKAAHLAQSGCEIVVADVQDADGLKVALAEASEVLVICPMNPRAEDAPAEHASMIGAIGTALEHVKPRSIVAISDYDAHHRTGTGVTLTFHLLEQRLRSIPAPAHFSVPQSTCKTGAGSSKMLPKPACSQPSTVQTRSSFLLFQLPMLALLLPICLPARIGREKTCRSCTWKILDGTQS